MIRNAVTLTIISTFVFLGFFPSIANAQNVKVNNENIGFFTSLGKGRPLVVCYRPDTTTAVLGTLNKKVLKPKARFKPINVELLSKKKVKYKKKKKKFRRKLKKVNRVLSAYSRFSASCLASGGDSATPDSPNDSGSTPPVSPPVNNPPVSQPTLSPPEVVPPPGISNDIPNEPFSGNAASLGKFREKLHPVEVKHLLDKVAFGGNQELFNIGVNQGLTPLVDALINGVMSKPEAADFNSQMNRWVDVQMYFEGPGKYSGVRMWTTEALQDGQIFRSAYSRNPFHEWMTYLLSTHFAINLNRIDFSYSDWGHFGLPIYWNLLRDNAVGNFENVVQAFWLDPAMGVWLDNINNHVGSPNENYARELIELFTLGAIDPVSGALNYDERTIKGVTAFASGFQESSQIDPANGADVIDVAYNDVLHDYGSYTIFHNVPGAEFTGNMQPEELVRHIMYNHPGSPRFIAERFAGQMLYPGLPEVVVAQLASTLRITNMK